MIENTNNNNMISTQDQNLFDAIRNGNPTWVSAALNRGAHVNVQDKDGNTPALFAIQISHIEAFKTLLHYGADVTIQNHAGETALSLLEKKVAQIHPPHPYYQPYHDILSSARKQITRSKNKPIVPLWDEKTQFHLGQELIQAVKDNNVVYASELLKQGANVLHENAQKETPIALASFYHFEEMISLLSDALNRSQSLIWAIYNYDTKKAIHFIEKGAHPMSYDRYGNLGVVVAGKLGLFDLVRYMISHGVDTNVHDNQGNTLMKYAIRLSDNQMVDFLLDHGFDYARHQNNYYQDFDTAIQQNNLYIVQKLIHTPFMAEKFLRSAIQHNANFIFDYFLSLNPNVKNQDSLSDPLLIPAIQNQNLHMTTVLLAKGVRYNQESNNQEWPLLEAVKTGNMDIMNQLRRHQLQVDKTNSTGWTALMEACKLANPEMIKALVQAGADINKADNNGMTAFMIAALNADRETVATLYHLDADINHQNHDGQSALTLAISNKNPAMARYLLFLGATPDKKTPNGNDLIFSALETGDVKLVDDLIAYGANINAKTADSYGHTPLTQAILNQQKEMVQLLLDRGADVNMPANYNHTPLSIAQGQFEYAKTHGLNPVAYEILDLITKACAQQTGPRLIKKADRLPPLSNQNTPTLEIE